jgi:SNF2 family DNA or RNA helicase
MKYQPARPRMEQQNRALAAARRAPSTPCPEDVFAYLMDYGTGKTQVMFDEWGEMAVNGGPQDFLGISGAGSYRNFFEDKSDLQIAEYKYMDPALVSRMVVLGWSAGGGKKMRERTERFLRIKDRPRMLFVNVEALSNVARVRELVTKFVSQRLTYGMIDESTSIKSRHSKRTKFLVNLGEDMAVRRIATGLLTPQGPPDAYSQFRFLDYRIIGCRSWQSFVGRYCVTRRMEVDGRRFDVIVDYRELDDLRDRMAPYSFRVLKSECLDLEPKKYVLWETEHTPEQRRLYRELKENATTQLPSGQFVSTEQVMTLVMRLHQINCGHVVDEKGVEHDVPSNRIGDLVELLGLHSGKAVIWTPFRRPIPKIKDGLEKAFGAGCTAEFHGGNKDLRSEEERRFLSDVNCRFMISTQSAGGKGNTWTVADLEVYYANDNDLEKRSNSEDRLHRKGQRNRVTIVDMVTPDTVDMKIVRRLRKKITMATTLTGEEAREWLI